MSVEHYTESVIVWLMSFGIQLRVFILLHILFVYFILAMRIEHFGSNNIRPLDKVENIDVDIYKISSRINIE